MIPTCWRLIESTLDDSERANREYEANLKLASSLGQFQLAGASLQQPCAQRRVRTAVA